MAGEDGGRRKVTSSRSPRAEARSNSATRCICTYFIHIGFESHRIKTSEVPLPLLCKDLTETRVNAISGCFSKENENPNLKG